MNHIYRVLWNAASATWMAVAETARGHGKGKSSKSAARRAAVVAWGALALVAPPFAFAQVASVVVAPGSNLNAYVAPNGVTVVNINQANSAGLSHNQYQSFNVNATGLVLNNTTSAQIAWQSQLAGQVTANFNQANAARVILNEVVSNNRSKLAGFTEVLGGRADVVLANPYGITCSGCGFINTDRVTLTTGNPFLASNGGLGGFSVGQGDILITGTGLNATAQQVLDLVTRSVRIEAPVNGQDVSVVAGTNRWSYDTRAVTGAATPTGSAPVYAIDTAALGGMYANRIRMTSTEAGVGVRMLGDAAASAGDFTLTAAGKVELQNRISASGDVGIATTATDANALALADASLTSTGKTTLAAAGGVTLSGSALVAGTDLAVSAASLLDTASASGLANNNLRRAGGALTLSVGNAASLGATEWSAAAAWNGTFGNLVTTGATKLYSSGGTLIASADKGDLALGLAVLQSAGNMALTSSGKIGTATGGALQSLGGNLALTAGNGISNAGTMTADKGAVTVRADGAIANSGTINAAGALDIADGLGNAALNSVSNSGNLLAGSTLALRAASIDNSATGWVQAATGSTVDAGSLNNSGAWLLSQQAIAKDTVTVGGALVNTGTIQSRGDATLSTGSVDNQGALLADGNLSVATSAGFSNGAKATTQAGSMLSVSAGGKIDNAAAAVMRGAAVALKAEQGLSNAGVVSAEAGSATLRVNGTLSNSGGLQTITTLDIADLNGGGSENIVNTGYMVVNGALALKAAAITNAVAGTDARNGRIQAGTNSSVNAVSIDNAGTWVLSQQGGGASQVTLTGALLNEAGATMQAGTAGGSESVTYNVAKIDNRGKLVATGNLQANVSASDGFANQDTVQAGGTLGIQGAATALTNGKNATLIGNGLNIDVAGIDNSGKIIGGASAATQLKASGTLTNRSGAVIAVATDAAGAGTVSGRTISNSGTVQSAGSLIVAMGTGGLTSSGDILSDGDLHLAATTNNDYTASIGGTLQSGKLLDVQGGTGSSLVLTGGAKNVASGATTNVAIGSVTLAKSSVLGSTGQMDLTVGTLTLNGDTNGTARVMGAVRGSGTATVTVSNDLSNDGLLFSGSNLVVKAPNLSNNATGGIVALHDMSIETTKGQLDLGTTTPAASAGNLSNAGSLYARNNLSVKVNGTLTNTSTINAGNKISLLANTLVNNRDIVSDGDIDIVAATLRNEVVGGDTRYWTYGAQTTVADGGQYNDGGSGGNKDFFRNYITTWTDFQRYANDQAPAYSPQILATKNLRLMFTTGSNLGGTVYGGQSITMQGFSVDASQSNSNLYKSSHGIWDEAGHGFQLTGGTFTNDNLALNTKNYTRHYTMTRKEAGPAGGAEIYDWSECNSGGGRYDGGCDYDSNGNKNQTFATASVNALHAGIYTKSLTGAGFALYNNSATTPLADPKAAVAAETPAAVIATQSFGAQTVDTVKAAQATGGTGLLAGISFVSANAALGVNGTSFGGINIPLPANPNGYYVTVKTPGAKYLVETNPLYQVGSSNVGSDYLSKLLGYNADEIGLRLGDASYEAYLVKQQLVAQTGNVILAQYANADAQMQGLMENAAGEARSLGLQYGKALTPEQQAGLRGDIVWMVQTVIDGKTVLAPVVYLAQSTKNNIASGAVISAQDANLSLSSLTNTGGTIVGGKSLLIASTGDISNLSGTIKGGDVSLTSTEGSIINKTLSSGNGGDKFYTTNIGNTATIQSTGTLSLDAKKDITNLGASVSAGTDASLKAGGNVTFDTIENKTTGTAGSVFKADGGTGRTVTTTTTVEQVKSGLTVGGNLSANAGKDITLAGTDAKVGGNAALDAGGDLEIIVRENSKTTHTESKASGFGMNNSLYGSTTVTTDSNSVRNVGSTLQVGGNASMTAGKDITVQGSSVDVKGSGTLNATNVNVLAGRNYDETNTTTKQSGFMQVGASSSSATSAGASAAAASKSDHNGASASASAQASAQASGRGAAGLAFSSSTTTATQTTDLKHVASSLAFGGDLAVNASKDVTLQGSSVSAGGNASVNAKNVNLLAAEDKSTSSTNVSTTRVGLMASTDNTVKAQAEASASAAAGKGIPNANASASAGVSASSDNRLDLVQKSDTTATTLDTRNQGSSISAGGNLAVKASDTLNVEGSKLASGGDMKLDAGNMTFKAVDDRHETTTQSSVTSAGLYASGKAEAGVEGGASAGLGAKAGVLAKAQASGEIGLYGSNTRGSTVDGSTTAQTSSISAGGNLTRTATNNITDVGTQIEAGGNLDQSAKTITSLAAANTTYSSAKSATDTAKVGVYAEASAEASASASAGPGAGKPGGTSSDAGAGIRASYQHDDSASKSASSNAVVSNIKVGGSVNSQSSGATTLEGSNIAAGKDVTIGASSLDYTAARNTASGSSNSTSAGGSVSVDLVNKSAAVGVNYAGGTSSGSSSTAVVGGISAGGNLAVATTGDTRFEGTNLAAGGAASVSAGGKLDFAAAKNTASASSQDVGVDVAVSAGLKGGSGSAAVNYAKSTSSSSDDVAGSVRSGSGPLTLKSGGDATFTGTQIASNSDIAVQAGGNLAFNAARSTSSSESLSVDVSAAASGGKKDNVGGTTNAATGKKTGGQTMDERSGEASVGVGYGKANSDIATGASIQSNGGNISLSSGRNTSLEGTQVAATGAIGVTAGGTVTQTEARSSSSSLGVAVSASGSGSSLTPEKKTGAKTPTTAPSPSTTTSTPTTTPTTTPTPAPAPATAPAPAGAPSAPPTSAPPKTPAQLTQKKGSGVASVGVETESSNTSQKTTLAGGQGVTVTQGTANPATRQISASVPMPATLPAGRTVAAKTADGKPLPAWLKLDPATGKFSGQPPADFKGELKVNVSVPQADGSVKTVPMSFSGN